MADFTLNDISCDFSNTLTDEIAVGLFLDVLGVPERAPTDENGNVNEAPQPSWNRTWTMVAAYSKNVQGLPAWRQLNPFDATDEEIRAARDAFFARFMKGESPIIVAWATALYKHMNGKSSLVSASEQSSGDASEDFLERKDSASTSASSMPAPGSAAKPSPTPNSKPSGAKKIPEAGLSPNG